ncbi:hypothetical protein B484DRAFT_394910 [Ochromonadaceae sp. CCMP2298]|nr:hypothetical protein B484DRAFT_394910 [Ochromonadaceae sp. CCMP2298]
MMIASAKNLSEKSDSVPLDNVRGARVLKRLHQKSSAKGNHPILNSYIAPHHTAIKKALKALKAERDAPGRRLHEWDDVPWSKVIKTGSMVVLHRPNGDCSGPVISVEVIGLDKCKNYNVDEGPYSVQLALNKVHGAYHVAHSVFEGAGCSGKPVGSYMDERWEDRCAMDVWNMNYFGATMQGIIVTGKSPKQLLREEEDGFLLTNHREDDCSDNIVGYTLHRGDACQLDVGEGADPLEFSLDNVDKEDITEVLALDSTYSYVKFTKSGPAPDGLGKCTQQEDYYYYGVYDDDYANVYSYGMCLNN